MESPVTSQDSRSSAPCPLNSQSTTVDSGYSSNINGKVKLQRQKSTSLKGKIFLESA